MPRPGTSSRLELARTSTPAAADAFNNLFAVVVKATEEYPSPEAVEAVALAMASLVVGGTELMRAMCARLGVVHSDLSFSVGRVPGSATSCGANTLSDAFII